ncbi:CDP-diacylglycerol--serine O-phosphatidyltransferase [Aggregatibacter aphrophilus]|uniref:CDP-diacylglycerol--serine O-phosphatidyltransferase n=1 Tax=Aggregatibacter aphrophilus TaxID=732 RepID=A0A336N541_AGGAP|nr:CDP-diacylglycerol--serine O-phosphatidyltransferase [Aggregatibacter aphrophilus]
MVNFIRYYLLDSDVVLPLDNVNRPKTKEIRQGIRHFRKICLFTGSTNCQVRSIFAVN